MPRTVFSMLTTTPRRRPSEGASPTPMMFSPRSVGSPTTQQILVVPMSSAVTYLERGKHLSWNVEKTTGDHIIGRFARHDNTSWQVIHRRDPALTPPQQAGEGISACVLQEMPANDGDVVEDAHAEGHDGRQIEVHTKPVPQVGQGTRGQGVQQKPGQEDLVFEVAVEPSLDRTQDRVESSEDRDRGVAGISRRNLDRGIEPEDDPDDPEDDGGRHQPQGFPRSARRQPHLWPRSRTAGAP